MTPSNDNPLASVSREELLQKRTKDISEFQRISFPTDPVLLYLITVTKIDGTQEQYFALPKDDAIILGNIQSIVFYDVIALDSIKEMAFVNCSLVIEKVVFNSFESIRDTKLVVYDTDMFCPRASKVLLGLPGIIRSK